MVPFNVLNREHQKIKIILQNQEKTGMIPADFRNNGREQRELPEENRPEFGNTIIPHPLPRRDAMSRKDYRMTVFLRYPYGFMPNQRLSSSSLLPEISWIPGDAL
jgi:hypothetical protein